MKRLFIRLMRCQNLAFLGSNDPTLVSYVTGARITDSADVIYIPDPVQLKAGKTEAASREDLGIRKDVVLITVFGALSVRKGIAKLLAAMEVIGEHAPIHVLLAGVQDLEVLRLLESPSAAALKRDGRLHLRNEFLSQTMEETVLAASTIVWLGYEGHCGMSGVMSQAGILGRPVIACREGLIGYLTERSGTGIVVDVKDAAEVARAIARLAEAGGEGLVHARNARVVYAPHAVEKVTEVFFQTLDRTSGTRRRSVIWA